jgi:putative transposase
MSLHHVNFHTLGRRPIFEQPEYDLMMRGCLRQVLRERHIVCLAWEVMPTHVHLLVQDFPEFPRSTILKQVKGDTARSFFQHYPHLREDLLGGHLWSKGYFAALVTSHQQCCATIAYIRNNRMQADLPPPIPLLPDDDTRR